MENKQNFKDLLTKMSVQKEKNIPIQKVVPTLSKKNNETNNDITKMSLSIYVNDWMDLTRLKNYKILEQKNLEYTMSDAIQYGLKLLEEKFQTKRNRDKITLKRGRRNKEKIEVKTTSIDLPLERINFINDFLYHKVFDEKEIYYTRPEMFAEMMKMVRNNNEIIFK